MKNWIKSYWDRCLSVLAISLSLFSLCRGEYLLFSESFLIWIIGISLSIAGISIAVIIGYQVYNTIVAEKKIKEIINKEISETKELIENKADENRHEFIALLHVSLSYQYLPDQDYESALGVLMKALNESRLSKSELAYNTVIEAIKLLENIINKNEIDFSIGIEKQLWYKHIVSKIKDKSISDIENFINNLKTRELEMSDEVKKLLQPFKKESVRD